MAREYCIQSSLVDDTTDVPLVLDVLVNLGQNVAVLSPRGNPVPPSQRFRVEEDGRIVSVALDKASELSDALTRPPANSSPLLAHFEPSNPFDPAKTQIQKWVFENVNKHTFIVLEHGKVVLTVSRENTKIADFTVLIRQFRKTIPEGQVWFFDELT